VNRPATAASSSAARTASLLFFAIYSTPHNVDADMTRVILNTGKISGYLYA
jgi:hypothetical protein